MHSHIYTTYLSLCLSLLADTHIHSYSNSQSPCQQFLTHIKLKVFVIGPPASVCVAVREEKGSLIGCYYVATVLEGGRYRLVDILLFGVPRLFLVHRHFSQLPVLSQYQVL